MLFILPDDVLQQVLLYLYTADLARVDTILRVPESIWTVAIRRRCGPTWPGGRAGVVRLYCAVHAQPPRTHSLYNAGAFICANECTVAAVQPGAGIHVWSPESMYYSCDVGRAACACLASDSQLAIGNEYGLMLYPQQVQLWSVAGVVDVACLRDGSIWFCSADQKVYSWNDGVVDQIICPPALCVSGPWGLIGTMAGTYPVPSLPVPCCCTKQSTTLACAWFVDGHVCTFSGGALKHVIQTGVLNPVAPLSVVGDVVCLGEIVYREGSVHDVCMQAERVCAYNGTNVIVRVQNGCIGIT